MVERLNVNPTRMELLSLKKRLETAQRGHRLLKDKRDELMREFMELVEKNRELREKVEKRLSDAFASFLMARAVMSEEGLESAIAFSSTDMAVDYNPSNIMGVSVAEFEWEPGAGNGENGNGVRGNAADGNGTNGDGASALAEIYPYGFAETSGDLDSFMHNMSETLSDLIELAEVEKSVMLLAEEIEKTRRRVNALEHVLIPRLQETIRYISMKLEERERGNLTRLMKIKEMLRGEEYAGEE